MHQIIIDQVTIPYLGLERTIRIYLPPNYEEDNSFPVIYMHDAQNLFDIETSSYGAIWDVHTHLNEYYNQTGQGMIVVGIDNYDGGFNRLNEYSPWVNTEIKNNALLADINEDVGGLGRDYIDFIVNELKPMMDIKYKTLPSREHTAMIGSSMGGLISLYAATVYPEIFSKIGAFSTAVWFAEEELLHAINKLDTNLPIKWYLDIGTNETSNDEKAEFNRLYLEGSKSVYQTLKEKVSEPNLRFIIEDGGIHNERDWSRRFPEAIAFLFKTPQD